LELNPPRIASNSFPGGSFRRGSSRSLRLSVQEKSVKVLGFRPFRGLRVNGGASRRHRVVCGILPLAEGGWAAPPSAQGKRLEKGNAWQISNMTG